MGSALYTTFTKLIVDDKIAVIAMTPAQVEAVALSHDELQAQTLRSVNQLRMRRGQDALYELPSGRPGNWKDCVLGRALGVIAGDAVRSDAVLMEFVRRFDRFEFPKLIDVGDMVARAGLNVADGDSVTFEVPHGKLTFMSTGAEFVPSHTHDVLSWVAPAPILEAEPV